MNEHTPDPGCPADAPTKVDVPTEVKARTPIEYEHASMVTKEEVAVKKIDVDRALVWLTAKLLPMLKQKFPEDAGIFTDAMSEIALTLVVAKQEIKEATSLVSKVGVLGGTVESIAAEVEKLSALKHMAGARKKEIVIVIASEIYEALDKGFDGDENNIELADILPQWLKGFIPTSASDKVERWLLSIAFSLAIDGIVSAWHRFGGS